MLGRYYLVEVERATTLRTLRMRVSWRRQQTHAQEPYSAPRAQSGPLRYSVQYRSVAPVQYEWAMIIVWMSTPGSHRGGSRDHCSGTRDSLALCASMRVKAESGHSLFKWVVYTVSQRFWVNTTSGTTLQRSSFHAGETSRACACAYGRTRVRAHYARAAACAHLRTRAI